MTSQTLTNAQVSTAEVQEKPAGGRPPKYAEPPTYEKLVPIDKQIVDYFAMDGLMPQNGEWLDETTGRPRKGRMVQVGTQEFAVSLGYANRQSLYDRQGAIPNFDELVLSRMPSLYRRYMVPAAWKGVGLRSMRGDAKQAEMLLSHYAGYVPPAQRHEVKIDGLAEAVNAARAAARKEAAIPVEATEGEIIPETVDKPVDDGDKVGDTNVPNIPAAPLPDVDEFDNPPITGNPGKTESIVNPDLVAIAPADVNQNAETVDVGPVNVNKNSANVMSMETPPPANVMSGPAEIDLSALPTPDVTNQHSDVTNEVTNQPQSDGAAEDEFGDPIREFE